MTIVQGKLGMFQIRKKLGNPTAPDPLDINGIYQVRRVKGTQKTVRMVFYAPTNPRTEAQQANRQKFADAMSAWGALTPEEKLAYNKRGKKRQTFGWCLFIREYYQTH